MNHPYQPQPRGGIAGLALLFCVAAGGAGLAFDFVLNAGASHSLFSAPGARAVIGAAAAAALVVAAHVLRRLLGRRLQREEPRDA